MAKRVADMTPRDRRLALRRRIVAWAREADARGDHADIVDSFSPAFLYAQSFIDYLESEAIMFFHRQDTPLFLLFVAATLDHASS